MRDLVSVCGLWKKTSKAGESYMSGKTKETVTIPAGCYINVFKVKNKKNENSPDYSIMYSYPVQQAPAQPQQQQMEQQQQQPVQQQDTFSNEEVPF